MSRDIAIVGASCVTSLGLDRERSWSGILAGRSGIGPFTAMESAPIPGKGGGQAPDLPENTDSSGSREIRYLRWAIRAAWREAFGHASCPVAPARCALVAGTTLHGMRSGGRYLRTGDPRHLASFLSGAVIREAIDGIPIGGLCISPCSACASGLTAVAIACQLLDARLADLVLACGYDPVSEYAYGGFNALRLVSSRSHAPFSRDRDGMKLAEGYGAVVLLRRDDAHRLGTRVLSRVTGIGGSSDAYHLSEPQPEGSGAARAMRSALDDAGIHPSDVGFLSAHATGTPDNDAAEYRAMRSVFGEALPGLPVTAFKSHLGHALGGAGAVELVLSLMALRERRVPPVAGDFDHPIEFEGLNLVTRSARPLDRPVALCSSFGFGGANACVVLDGRDPDLLPAVPRPAADLREEAAWITGVGVILPSAPDHAFFISRIEDPEREPITGDEGEVPESMLAPLLRSRRVRRMSAYVKLTLAATARAYRDAGLDRSETTSEAAGSVLGTTHGSASFCHAYYEQIVREGVASANPLLFAEGVPNAASAHVSMMLGLRGPCQTLIGSRTAGLDAITLALARISAGESFVIVSAADEYSSVTNRPYAACGLYAGARSGSPWSDARGFATGAAAVTLVLERAATARRRGARCLGVVEASASAVFRRSHGSEPVYGAVDAIRRIGAPRFWVTSANNTWIDVLEAASIAEACRAESVAQPAVVTAIYGHHAESFSAAPLAGLASVLLSGHLPRLLGPAKLPAGLLASRGTERPTVFGILATDYAGHLTALRIRIGGDSV